MNIPALKEIIEERKGKAIENLSESFSKNRLPLEEYERLVEYINKIESERELVVVEKMVAEYAAEEKTADVSGSLSDDDDDDISGDFQSGPSGGMTILSSRTVSGPLKSGSQFFSFLGSTHIRVRKEDLAKKRNSINITTILGDMVIYVESGIRVNNKAIPILGSASTDHKIKKESKDCEFELNISGAVLLGEIKVKLLK